MQQIGRTIRNMAHAILRPIYNIILIIQKLGATAKKTIEFLKSALKIHG